MNSYALRMVLVWMPNNADSVWRKVGEKLKRRALLAIIIHCRTKSARIAPLKTFTDSYSWFLPRAQPYLNSVTRAPKSIPYTFTSRSRSCLFTLKGSVRYLINLLKYSLLYQFCWIIPNPNTLLRFYQSYFVTELYLILVHCRTMAYLKILLSALAKRCRQPIRIEYYVSQ